MRTSLACRASLAVWMIVTQAGCFSWESVPLQAPAPERVGYVRVVRTDGQKIRLALSRLTADSLTGRRAGLITTRRISIPLDSLQSVERRRTDWLRSAGLGVLMLAGAALSAVIVPPWGEP